MDRLIILGLCALVWWYRRRVQHEVAGRAVVTAELESLCRLDEGRGPLTGGQKKQIAVAAFLDWIPWGFAPLTPLGLDWLIEQEVRRLKNRAGLS